MISHINQEVTCASEEIQSINLNISLISKEYYAVILKAISKFSTFLSSVSYSFFTSTFASLGSLPITSLPCKICPMTFEMFLSESFVTHCILFLFKLCLLETFGIHISDGQVICKQQGYRVIVTALY